MEVSLAQPLVQDALAGDERAFVLLVEPLLPAAYRLAVGMLRSDSEAEDAVQEAVFKAWMNVELHARRSTWSWLATDLEQLARRSADGSSVGEHRLAPHERPDGATANCLALVCAERMLVEELLSPDHRLMR